MLIREKYLSKIEVIDISTKDKKTIKIKGSYGESAWGISSLFVKKEGNNIIIAISIISIIIHNTISFYAYK